MDPIKTASSSPSSGPRDRTGAPAIDTAWRQPRPDAPLGTNPSLEAQARPLDAPTVPHGRWRIGILIVAYNAVSTIAPVLKRIPEKVWSEVEEVVIFDDASRDHTYELVVGLKMLAGFEKLTVIKNEKNLGYGGNQKLGYRYFIDKGFDVVVLLHGDGQYAPEILGELYGPIVSGQADAVFGSRMMKTYGGALRGGMPLYKFVGNKILTFFENASLGMRLTEFHSGYRAYSIDALRRIDMSSMTDVFHFDTQIIIKLHHQGFRIKEVPIPTYYGEEICYVNGMRYARDVFLAVRRYRSTARSVACFPEYREYYVHYPLKESRRSSYEYFMRWIGQGHQVLDLGCGEGFFAQRVAEQGNAVTGIDMLDEPQCAGVLQQYLRADLAAGLRPVIGQLRVREFDRVLLQDVLEHVPEPERLLAECRDVLRPAGQVLVSLPNVANIVVRLSLLFGRFEYTQRGILDKTHLRFFTLRSARKLIEQAGFEIVAEKATVMPVELALGLRSTSAVARVINVMLAPFTALLPRLFGYQLLFAARPRIATRTDAVSAGA